MLEKNPLLTFLSHFILICGVVIIAFPLYIAFVASTQTTAEILHGPMSLIPGNHFFENVKAALFDSDGRAPLTRMLWVSFVMAMGIAIGKIVLSYLAAFALVYFDFKFKDFFFGLIFITLMLPVEVRIAPTFEVVSNLNLTNQFGGLILPLIASATGTFLLRQFFMTIPDELIEASRMDGASPLRFLWDILLPLSKTNLAALFVIQFIYGWNQYLWPLVMKTSEEMTTIIIGIKSMMGGSDSAVEWGVVMASVLIAIIPPLLVVLLMQRWFVKGLIDSDK